MKALILNSGTGSRMGAVTDSRPKCLVELSTGTTILARQLAMLQSRGIREIVITTGPYAELIEDHVRSLFPGLDVSFVNNPKYDSTNYIYSMHLARNLIDSDDDTLLLHGDIVTELSVFDALLSADAASAVIVSRPPVLPEKDFKARIENGSVSEISVSLASPDCVFLLPFYRFSKDAMRIWLAEIVKFVERGIVGVYAEEAFNKIAGQIGLAPVCIGEQDLCMEVDNPQDLDLARALAANKKI